MSSITKQPSSISCSRRKVSSSTTELRLVLLGKTGSGKSSTANSILGRKVFDLKVSGSSVTQRCHRVGGEFRKRQLMLLDTPGLMDSHDFPQDMQKELRRSVSLLFPGPHAFLIVIQIGRFTQEERDAVRQIKEAMGSHALSFSVVVFTHGDHLEQGTTVKQCLIDQCEDLAELVAGCGGRYCVFNNQSSKSKGQVLELLALVDGMMQANKESCYTSKFLKKAEVNLSHQLQDENRLLNEKEEMSKNKQEEAIKDQYKKEVEMVQQKCKREMEEPKKHQELEREKVEELVRHQEEAFRGEMDENDEMERKIQEIVRLVVICREEEKKREVLQKKLEKVIKQLEEQVEWEQEMKRSLKVKIQKHIAENEKRAKEKEPQQIQEQAIRMRERMKTDLLQMELNKLIQKLEERGSKEEERKKQMEEILRREREENRRERDLQMENQRAEKWGTVALQQELKLIKMKIEKQKATEESLKRPLQDNLRKGREKCDEEMSALKKRCDKKCSDMIAKKPAEKHSTVTTVTGYVQEMGLLGLNVALESIGAPCCIQ